MLLWLVVMPLAIVALLVAAYGFLVHLENGGSIVWSLYDPPIIRGISCEESHKTKVFDKRLQSAVPIGLPETDLRRELEVQGFHGPKDLRRVSYRTSEGFICGIGWQVFWRTNGSGVVSKVRGTVTRRCL